MTPRRKRRIESIVDLLSTSNPLLDDMCWKKSPHKVSRRTITRVGLPGCIWRILGAKWHLLPGEIGDYLAIMAEVAQLEMSKGNPTFQGVPIIHVNELTP